MGVGEAIAGTASNVRRRTWRAWTQAEIFSSRGNILRDLDRLHAAGEVFLQVVASARVHMWLFFQSGTLTSLPDFHVFSGRMGILSTELRKAIASSPRQFDRRGLVVLHEVLIRICDGTSFCMQLSCL